jgi:hypothetical protein
VKSRITIVASSIEGKIARCAFIDENKIYSCIDIGPLDIDADGRLVIGAIRSGRPPAPFGKNWKGEDGPFILIFFDSIRGKCA